jgi:hypothetical protein
LYFPASGWLPGRKTSAIISPANKSTPHAIAAQKNLCLLAIIAHPLMFIDYYAQCPLPFKISAVSRQMPLRDCFSPLRIPPPALTELRWRWNKNEKYRTKILFFLSLDPSKAAFDTESYLNR